jgi:hypothetical protein
MYNRRVLASFVLISIHSLVFGQSDPINHSAHYMFGFAGQSAIVLGSQDSRVAFGFDYGYGRPEPRFQRGSVLAQIVYEAYYDQSSGLPLAGSNLHTDALGGLGIGRWFWPRDSQNRSMYFDLGWGFQYANHPSFDLDTKWNSTPITGFGALFPTGSREFMVGVRYLHISNGGTDKPNRGQNQILFTIGVKF